MKRLLLATIVSLLVASPALAQQGDPDCYIVFCSTNSKKCLVLDGNKDWLPDVRVMAMKVDYPTESYAALQIWSGVYTPSQPATERRNIAGIATVDEAAFDTLVDDLQGDPGAAAQLF